MKNFAYLLYALGIILFIILITRYKSKGLGDITPLFLYSGLIICVIGVVSVFLFPQLSSFIKKMLFGVSIGIVGLIGIVAGIYFFEKWKTEKRITKYSSEVQKQKEYYSKFDLLENFEVELDRNKNKINAITSHLQFSQDTLLNNWNVQLFVFIKPDQNKTLLTYTLFKSEAVPIQSQNLQQIPAYFSSNTYKLDRLKKELGDSFKLEYLVLLTNPRATYRENGLNEGLAYTSLSNQEIEMRDSKLSVMQSKQYPLFHNNKMSSTKVVPINDFTPLLDSVH
ncbi:hypothetical protein OOZ15_00970 [Galbibacter sp. EGI 63066]|uniref:hypothetical protein n=1 Tax=Galbibacter sp. EGI 63066 TaxID=2993559 RepID=UPI0022488D3A|nr:hypothetical protein [Galbibacter sp. EGI 63066]MCX2678501.1 hypothetical protein [Galbibacter sp. EGI 63066]